MQITSAKFMRGVNGTDELLDDGTPQVALIGRSNVGKSSIINSLTRQKNLAHTSDTPGLTQEINAYSINNKFYLLDLPGYGFAKVPERIRESLQKLNWWYLFDSEHVQYHAVLVLDANVGPSKNDLEMLTLLREHQKNIVIVANKIDKIPRAEYDARLAVITDLAHGAPVVPYSSKTGKGTEELVNAIFGK
ncbi:MAG: ribosome biogenesis GTP-binding protein YihA/YsxC [Minisyncoccia bacterium]|jgi:GTP-binding protein